MMVLDALIRGFNGHVAFRERRPGVQSHLTGLGLENTDSVVKVLIGARPAAVDPRQQRSATRQGDSRQRGE
jgi:hypothetical protein